MLIPVLLSCLLLSAQRHYYEGAGLLKLLQGTIEILRMKKSVPDQENCSDVQIWNENGKTYNNRTGHTEMSLIDNWMTGDPDFASVKSAENVPSTSKAGNTAWHNVWTLGSVKQLSDQQKKEERREKNRRSAKVSRESKKQIHLRAKKDFEYLKMENTKLTDDVERLKIKVDNLKIIKDSIIHQESCKDKCDTVDINEHNSGCTSNMPEQTVEEMKDNSHTEIILTEKDVTNDNMCVTGCGYYQQQEQQPIEQETGTQPGLSSTQGNLFASSYSYALSSSGASLLSMSGTSQVTMPASQDSNLTYSLNFNTNNDQLSLIPGQNVSHQSSLIPVRNVSDQLSLTPAINVSDQLTLTPARNISDQLTLTPAINVSDQPSLIPTSNVSEKPSLTPVQVTVNTNTAVVNSQSNSSYLSQQARSVNHSTLAPWCVEPGQNDDKEMQNLMNFFLE